MPISQAYLDEYDEPFGFMDFASVGALSKRARRRVAEDIETMSAHSGKIVPDLLDQAEKTYELVATLFGTDRQFGPSGLVDPQRRGDRCGVG